MPRFLLVCISIVAAFRGNLAAAAVVEEAPVTQPVAALAARLEIDPSRNRSGFIADLVRLLYYTVDARPPALTSPRGAAAVRARTDVTSVPVPLGAAVWSRAVFRRSVPADQLLPAILTDRHAALLCSGLLGVDDETLAYLAEHPAIVTFLYEQAAPAVAAFGDVLRIRDGRIVLPGGPDAAPLWEAAAHVSLNSPEQFLRALFVEYNSRLAYLASVIGAAPPAAARFALGSWIADEPTRMRRFEALLLACARSYREWNPAERPFLRPLGDLAMLLVRIRVDESGTPAPPVEPAFWAAVYGSNPAASTELESVPLESIDAAWLVDATGGEDMYSRTERLDEFAFGQRVFDDTVDPSARLVAAGSLAAFRRHRMLMLTLERMGIRTPSTFAAAIERADSLEEGSSNRRFWTFGQFQGSLALLSRMHHNGTIDAARAEALVLSLCAVPSSDGEYDGGIAEWIRTELEKSLPASPTWEGRALGALAGPASGEDAPTVAWEGETYRLDFSHAEHQRLVIVRGKQGGHTLDLALALDAVARKLRSQTLSLDEVHGAISDIRAIAEEYEAGLRTPPVNLLAPAVQTPRDGLVWTNAAAQDLARITRPSDLRRAARSSASLHQLADIVLGNALVSLAYAAEIGDPEGAALLAGNVALRHDFGFARKDSQSRAKLPWALPRQDFQPGVPWHVTGSLLGLDIALAPLSLRRLTIDRVADAPKLSSIEREALAVNVNLLQPGRMKDADREIIAAAIARGRERVVALTDGSESLARIAETLGFDGWRVRSMRWSLDRAPWLVLGQFSLGDMLVLGGGAPGVDLDAWGTPGLYLDGCACVRFPDPRAWRMLAGRYQLPMMTATMGDLNLALALMLRDMNLPSALARPILAYGMQDFIDEMKIASGNDWRGLAQQAQSIQRNRVEDYVAAAAAVNGPLVPAEEPDGFRQR